MTNENQGAGCEDVPYFWPVSLRGILVTMIITTALALGAASRTERSSSDGRSSGVPDLVLDPNTAPRQVLVALPHAGPTLVGRLVEARKARLFSSAQDARQRVIGLGPSTLAKLAPHLRFATNPGPDADDVANTVLRRIGGVKKHIARRTKARPEQVTSLATQLTSLDSKTDSFQ